MRRLLIAYEIGDVRLPQLDRMARFRLEIVTLLRTPKTGSMSS
jgi:hypothetical protein